MPAAAAIRPWRIAHQRAYAAKGLHHLLAHLESRRANAGAQPGPQGAAWGLLAQHANGVLQHAADRAFPAICIVEA
jgi:hypothetical protein